MKKIIDNKKEYMEPKIVKIGEVVKNTLGAISGGNDSGASFHNIGGSNS
jgi:hypothetical protein